MIHKACLGTIGSLPFRAIVVLIWLQLQSTKFVEQHGASAVVLVQELNQERSFCMYVELPLSIVCQIHPGIESKVPSFVHVCHRSSQEP